MADLIIGREADETIMDMNSQVIRMTMACLVKRAGGRLVVKPEELREMLTMDADLNFVGLDDGAIEFTLTQVTAPQGIKLT